MDHLFQTGRSGFACLVEPTIPSSPNLIQANQQLLALRARFKTSREYVATNTFERSNSHTDELVPVNVLPAHLGWGSERLTAVLRAAVCRGEKTAESCQEDGEPGEGAGYEPASTQPIQTPGTTATPAISGQAFEPDADFIKLYPDLALGMLGQGQVGAGRIWLLLRWLDRAGCGKLRITNTKEQLTTPTSAYYLCGERQLRKLLKAGEGIFWQRDGEQLWLRSVAKVAVALGVERLNSRPIALTLAALLGGVGEVKAHFYASFHSGRKSHSPISRETLEKVTHVPTRTQRAYEKTAGISAKRNMAVGEQYSAETVQQRAWFHGRGVFDFIDHHGKQGPEKRHYVAWHLPNSYTGCHAGCSRGRQKKINQEIGLVRGQARGNDFRRQRLFHPDGATAAKTYNRDSSKDRYWHQDTRQHSANGRGSSQCLWWVLVAKEVN